MTNEYTNYFEFIKSQTQDGIFSHPDVQQKMLMIMGNEKNKKLELSKEEEKKIAQSYVKMHVALSAIRWCQGETLGVARQKSLEQLNSYVKSKTNIAHPMNKYLMAINAQVHREVAEINMKDSNSNKKVEMTSALKQRWIQEETKKFQQSMQVLNDMYKKYMPEKTLDKMPAAKSFETAKQKAQQMMQQILMLQINQTKQRAA